MSLILPNLFLSSVNFAKNEQFLQSNKIRFILIAAKGLKRYFPKQFTYTQIPIKDNPGTLIIKHFITSIEFIHSNRQIGAVLVHCLGGKSRSVTIIIAYLMLLEKLKAPQAIELLKTKYITVLPNDGFRKQLNFWEVVLNHHFKNNDQFDFVGLKYSLDHFDISKLKIQEIISNGPPQNDEEEDPDQNQAEEEPQLQQFQQFEQHQ